MKQKFVAAVAAVGITVYGLGGYVGRAAERRPKPTATPVVVELFTSRADSRSQAAQGVLTSLLEQQPIDGVRVIALGEPVEQGGRAGSVAFAGRQGSYSGRTGGGDAYTPQMVIDGAEHFYGGNGQRARAAVARAAEEPKAKVALLGGDEGGPFMVRAAEVPTWRLAEGEKIEVYAAVVEGAGAGAVTRSMEKIGEWDPAASEDYREDFAPSVGTRDRRVVVFLQAERSRRILGAAEAVP